MADYFDWNNFGTGASNRYVGQRTWGSGELSNPLEQSVMQGTEIFKQNFRNLLGRDPTPQELGDFQVNALPSAIQGSGQGAGYGDMTGIANSYIQNQFGPEAVQHEQQTQTDQLGNSQSLVQDLINKTMKSTSDQFADPLSSLYQGFSGKMNNLGISPSSGAFQAGAGSTIADAGMSAANTALNNIGIPTIQGIQGLSGTPYQNSMSSGTSAVTDLNNIRDFNLQAELAQSLASMGGPSGAQGILGMATGASQGAGSLLGGIGEYKKGGGTSYVCKELIKRGLLHESDMDEFHAHIMPAMFKKGRAFWKYAMDGKALVDAVNVRGDEAQRIWWAAKPLLFDRVMGEHDPAKAVDFYAEACFFLTKISDPRLWDHRVLKTSYWDSLFFLSRLFLYRPFLEALRKCVRRKMAIIYDYPNYKVYL